MSLIKQNISIYSKEDLIKIMQEQDYNKNNTDQINCEKIKLNIDYDNETKSIYLPLYNEINNVNKNNDNHEENEDENINKLIDFENENEINYYNNFIDNVDNIANETNNKINDNENINDDDENINDDDDNENKNKNNENNNDENNNIYECNEYPNKEKRIKYFMYNLKMAQSIEDNNISNVIIFNICISYLDVFNDNRFIDLRKSIFNKILKFIEIGYYDYIKFGCILFKNFKKHIYENHNMKLYKKDNTINYDLLENINMIDINNKINSSILYAKTIKPKFREGQIIGASDKNNKWWMSMVKKIFIVDKKIVYLIKFIGWDNSCDEFIEQGNRLTYYNPYKHKQFYNNQLEHKNIINVDTYN